MELKKHNGFRNFMIAMYFVSFATFFAIGFSPAFATDYDINAQIEIPSINLMSDVTALEVDENRLNTPDFIVGSYSRAENKTLLIGHSTTVFSNLDNVKIGNVIFYNGKEYLIENAEVVEKSTIFMRELLEPEEHDTLVIMTCAGEIYDNGDASHRLIVTATAI